jgi:hypothetical protein
VTVAGAKHKLTADDFAYLEFVKKASAGDVSIDFRAFRLACAKASNCDPSGDSDDVVSMRRAVQAGNNERAVEAAEKLIQSGFPNIEAHIVLARAFAALKNPDKAEFHKSVASALIHSILRSGDGKTKETAFEVIGISEEHVILGVLGLPPFGRQSLLTGKPHNYDVIEVDDPKTAQKVSVYFNIDAFYPMKGCDSCTSLLRPLAAVRSSAQPNFRSY